MVKGAGIEVPKEEDGQAHGRIRSRSTPNVRPWPSIGGAGVILVLDHGEVQARADPTCIQGRLRASDTESKPGSLDLTAESTSIIVAVGRDRYSWGFNKKWEINFRHVSVGRKDGVVCRADESQRYLTCSVTIHVMYCLDT